MIISGHFDKKVRLWDNRSSSSEPMNELVVGGKVNMSLGGMIMIIGGKVNMIMGGMIMIMEGMIMIMGGIIMIMRGKLNMI